MKKKYAEKQTKKSNQSNAFETKFINKKKTAKNLINRLKTRKLLRKKRKIIQIKFE